ncbi:hypothetical protein BST81_15475 [Leptolyngbya sp. 'hensonii']|uniref:DUF2839 domain-containing protein n=1 Tax=Leptolyngbya sp. 'hensonii' TaxID=1922337 RepID=UPI00094FC800|nr:DUF2839 domain-containing protein [Leptolyngbya sp. 'hensonii']OLP17717.1 hypothetical protein BST81_15475 [Leptolyngbya sp. 'hensonii']
MGDSKRRKEILGEKYGQDERIASWLPVTKGQGQQFVNWTTTGAWIGIGGLVVAWVVIRFVGPAMGWWHLS